MRVSFIVLVVAVLAIGCVVLFVDFEKLVYEQQFGDPLVTDRLLRVLEASENSSIELDGFCLTYKRVPYNGVQYSLVLGGEGRRKTFIFSKGISNYDVYTHDGLSGPYSDYSKGSRRYWKVTSRKALNRLIDAKVFSSRNQLLSDKLAVSAWLKIRGE